MAKHNGWLRRRGPGPRERRRRRSGRCVVPPRGPRRQGRARRRRRRFRRRRLPRGRPQRSPRSSRFRDHPHRRAPSGTHGGGAKRHGGRGEDLVVPVPEGTVVRRLDGEVLADLVRHGDRCCAARAARGARQRPVPLQRPRAPAFAEQGELRRGALARPRAEAARRCRARRLPQRGQVAR